MDPIKTEEKGSEETQDDKAVVAEDTAAEQTEEVEAVEVMSQDQDVETSEVLEAEEVKEPADQLESLKEAVASKIVEIEELNALLSQKEQSFDAEKKELSDKLAELEAKLVDSTKLLEETAKGKELAEEELVRIKRESLLDSRVKELAERSLLRTSEEAKEKQISKVRAMSDDEFISYMEELTEIKGLATSESELSFSDKESIEVDQEIATMIQSLLGKEGSDEAVKDNLKKMISALKEESKEEPALDAEKSNQERASEARPGLPELTKVFTGIMYRK
jgi:hypothetical protein